MGLKLKQNSFHFYSFLLPISRSSLSLSSTGFASLLIRQLPAAMSCSPLRPALPLPPVNFYNAAQPYPAVRFYSFLLLYSVALSAAQPFLSLYFYSFVLWYPAALSLSIYIYIFFFYIYIYICLTLYQTMMSPYTYIYIYVHVI